MIQNGLSLPDAGPHHVCDCPPALDDPPRRPDPGGGGGADRGARHARQTLYALGGRYYDLYTRQHGLEANRSLRRAKVKSYLKS